MLKASFNGQTRIQTFLKCKLIGSRNQVADKPENAKVYARCIFIKVRTLRSRNFSSSAHQSTSDAAVHSISYLKLRDSEANSQGK